MFTLFVKAYLHAAASRHYGKIADVLSDRMMTFGKQAVVVEAVDEMRRASALAEHHAGRAIDLLNDVPRRIYGNE